MSAPSQRVVAQYVLIMGVAAAGVALLVYTAYRRGQQSQLRQRRGSLLDHYDMILTTDNNTDDNIDNEPNTSPQPQSNPTDELNQQLIAAEKSFKEQIEQISELHARCTSAEKQSSELVALNQKLKRQSDELSQQIEQLKQQNNSQQTEMHRLNEEQGQTMSDLNQRLNETLTKLATKQQEMANLSELNQKLESKSKEETAKQQMKMNQLNERVTVEEEKTNKQKQHIQELTTRLAKAEQHQSELSELNQEFQNKLKADNEKQQMEMNAMQQRVTAEEEKTNKQKQQIHELMHRLAEAEQHKADLSELNQELEAELQELTQLEETQIAELAELRRIKFEYECRFNEQPKSEYLPIRNHKVIKNTYRNNGYHSITFGRVIQSDFKSKYRVRFRVNKMAYGFYIGYAAKPSDLKDVDKDWPGKGQNKETSTGICMSFDNTFWLYDSTHSGADEDQLKVVDEKWAKTGWYEEGKGARVGFQFVMQFDFATSVFALYWMRKKKMRKLFEIEKIPQSVVPVFSFYNKQDEIEIIECALE